MESSQDILIEEICRGPRRLRAICRNAERSEIARALMEHQQNRTHTAQALGISRRTLLNKIKEYGITENRCGAFATAPALPF